MPRLALITGPTSGIGRAFAQALAADGHDLILVARDAQRLCELDDELSERHATTSILLTTDLSGDAGMAAASQALTDHPVDLLVNNAGSSFRGWFGETTIADEDAHLDLLVRAPMHLMDAAIKSMRMRGGGGIINVSSVAAYTPRGTYAAHKAWLVNLSRWLNVHYASTGIRTMALCPGLTRTEFHQRMGDDMAGVPRWMWLDADRLVRDALRDLDRGKAVSVPSLRYKVLALLARTAPDSIVKHVAQRGRP